jgi:hypothetical protein
MHARKIAKQAKKSYVTRVNCGGQKMIEVLTILRDFFVAVLIGWLGLAAEPADNSSKAEPAPAETTQIAVLRLS